MLWERGRKAEPQRWHRNTAVGQIYRARTTTAPLKRGIHPHRAFQRGGAGLSGAGLSGPGWAGGSARAQPGGAQPGGAQRSPTPGISSKYAESAAAAVNIDRDRVASASSRVAMAARMA